MATGIGCKRCPRYPTPSIRRDQEAIPDLLPRKGGREREREGSCLCNSVPFGMFRFVPFRHVGFSFCRFHLSGFRCFASSLLFPCMIPLSLFLPPFRTSTEMWERERERERDHVFEIVCHLVSFVSFRFVPFHVGFICLVSVASLHRFHFLAKRFVNTSKPSDHLF